ncbi:hypothetical protein HYX04_04205 [Candidatus Woesearchaeota archaeon]|nr:hypothetical protein [Candidatus Woesearchaeota archaeon]
MTSESDLEKILKRESDLMSLADAWIAQTGGEIIAGVVIDREEYIHRIQELPIWGSVKDNLEEHIVLMQKSTRGRKIDQDATTKHNYLLRDALKIQYVLEHFLDDPDYATGKHNNKSFGDSIDLKTVLRDYRTDLDGMSHAKGDLIRIQYKIFERKLTEEQVLDAIGLKERWEEYQKTTGIPKEYQELARQIIGSFLDDPDYCVGGGNTVFGAAMTLKGMLKHFNLNANEGENDIIRLLAGARRLHWALSKNRLTEEQVLDAIGLKERWEEYQKTTGIPKEYQELARQVLDSFLEDPDYCSRTSSAQFGAPMSLKAVFKNYYKTFNNETNGRELYLRIKKISYALRKSRLTEEQVLDAIGLKERWEEYQKTTGIPKECQEMARYVLEHFLANPHYSRSTNSSGLPLKLGTVLQIYRTDLNDGNGGFKQSDGEAKKVSRHVYGGRIDGNRLLRVIGLFDQWQAYQKSSADNPFVYKPAQKAG